MFKPENNFNDRIEILPEDVEILIEEEERTGKSFDPKKYDERIDEIARQRKAMEVTDSQRINELRGQIASQGNGGENTENPNKDLDDKLFEQVADLGRATGAISDKFLGNLEEATLEEARGKGKPTFRERFKGWFSK